MVLNILDHYFSDSPSLDSEVYSYPSNRCCNKIVSYCAPVCLHDRIGSLINACMLICYEYTMGVTYMHAGPLATLNNMSQLITPLSS